MTTTRGQLTDTLLRDALRDLAAGPDASALTADVLQQLGETRQARRLAWPMFQHDRRVALVGLTALLVVGLIGAAIAAGMLPSTRPVHRAPISLVVQQWNGQRDPASVVTHLRFSPGASVGTPLTGLPPNAVGLRWSPDGARLAYFERNAPQELHGVPLTSLFLANRDGMNPAPVRLPRSIDDYVSNGFWSGVQWAPTGGRFLLVWSPNSCSDGPDCIPPAGVDVFDAAGNVLGLIDTPDNVGLEASWSPDGLAVGWTSGACANSTCTATAYHWRRVSGDPSVTTIQMGGIGQVVWSRDEFLHVVKIDDAGATGVVTMAPDGSSVRTVGWAIRTTESGPVWSPDGRFLAAVDMTTWSLRVRDVQAGIDRVVQIPEGFLIAAWAPDSSEIVLYGGASSSDSTAGYGFAVVGADGTGLITLGDGEDYGWLPGVSVPP